MSNLGYSDRPAKYRNYSIDEWNLKKCFTYDDHLGFSDLKIFDMQNNYRYHTQFEDFGLPYDSASFCTAFSDNRQRHRFVQMHLCDNMCFWDPKQCFLNDNHSGNLADLMHKDFHEKFNPLFAKQFERNYSGKIDWSPTGGPGLFYPTIGIKKLIAELGVTTKLVYDNENCAVNSDNLRRELRDSIPVRPIYVMEEKKCHDIIDVLLNVNREKIERSRKDMQNIFDESYKGNGVCRKPILSLMMWGPYADFKLRKTDKECKLDNLQSGLHVCTNFSQKHYWMYSHSTRISCSIGPILNLEGPAMTSELKVVYPCNRAGCNHECLCDLCINSLKCPKLEHQKHLKESNSKCIVAEESECQIHVIDHPENFNRTEDISVEKNIFYHNLKLVDQPRKHSTGNIMFAGIKTKCKVCRLNIKDHFKHHKVIHLQCKFCVYQMKTALDKNFWNKVCNTCGKTFSNTKSLKYWHRKIHSQQWSCEGCDIDFNRKWNLKRHLEEVHGMAFSEIDSNSEEDSSEENLTQSDIKSEEDTDFESSDTDNDSSKNDEYSMNQFQCKFCEKDFRVQRYLDTHIKVHHTEKQSFKCDNCDKTFTQKEHLKRHEETVHGQEKKGHLNLTGEKTKNTCEFCGTNFTRIDNLNEHIKRAHLEENKIFTCRNCEKKFDRKWNLKRHEQKCIS